MHSLRKPSGESIVRITRDKWESKVEQRPDPKTSLPPLCSRKVMSSQATAMLTGAGFNGRPVVFFDITIGETPVGRIKFELFSDFVPK